MSDLNVREAGKDEKAFIAHVLQSLTAFQRINGIPNNVMTSACMSKVAMILSYETDEGDDEKCLEAFKKTLATFRKSFADFKKRNADA